MPLRNRYEPTRRRRAPRRVHALVIAGLAAVALALAAGAASANTLSVSEEDFALTFPELSFSADLGVAIICSFTLSGSFHSRSITKSIGSLLGQITNVSLSGCQGDGAATVLTETLPWHVTYHGFFEELPTIEGVLLQLRGIGLRVEDGVPCLFSTEANEPMGGIVALDGSTGEATSFTADEQYEIDLENEGFLCSLAGDSRFRGTATMTTDEGGELFITLGGGPTPADLRASPTAVTIEELESSDTFTLRNTGGSTATVDSVEDERATQFDVSGCGEGRTIVVEASCVYTIEVDERPLPSGRVTITYDDGAGGTRRVSVEVDIAGEDDEARLDATPTGVAIEALEQNDIVTIRNNGGGDTAAIDRVTTTTTDSESPEFTVITTGCGEDLRDNESCNYLISVNSRPETNGSITVEYDDNGGAGVNKRLVIEVDIAGPDPAELEADPTEVGIERLEANDSFVLRNISPDTGAVINTAILTSDDTERPDFSVTGIGCPEIYVAGASCTYVVTVNSRPEADGTYTIEYDDGAGEDREVTVSVDIRS